MTYELSGWKLKGLWPHEAVFADYHLDHTAGVTDWIDAAVPGGVHADLQAAGWIADPFVDANSLLCEWVEHRHWAYRCDWSTPPERPLRAELHFTGIDDRADVLINARKVTHLCGMYRTHIVDVTDRLSYGGTTRIETVFDGVPEESPMFGYTGRTFTQKSRFNYRWDFSTRLVNIGLYDRVLLKTYSLAAIREAQVRPVPVDNGWQVQVSLTVEGFRMGPQAFFLVELDGRESRIPAAIREGEQRIDFVLQAGEKRLWWPNGMGEQPLYPLVIRLCDEQGESDRYTGRVGFRTLSFVRTAGAPEDALPYQAVVNGRPVFLKGVNFVPLHHLYGCVGDDTYRARLRQARDAHVNAVRVWGGGIIEKEIFYDLCDEYGILIWQDFIQSSAGGFADFPSKDPAFLALLRETALFAVRQKRNHVCLTYWCGGNELTDDRYDGRSRRPVGFEDANIAMLRDIVQQNDPDRLMLPSTASGGAMCLDFGQEQRAYDIHGPWVYLGFTDEYRLLNGSRAMLHSEMGADGMSDLAVLRRFLSPEYIGVHAGTDNPVWRLHGSCWDTYTTREKPLLGTFRDEELPLLIDCSQFFQAEGVRYLIESNRRRAPATAGCLIWQFNEPYPNIACTNLVSFDGTPKLAYTFMQNSYRPLLPTARYDRLLYTPGETVEVTLFAHKEGAAEPYTLTAFLETEDAAKELGVFSGTTEPDRAAACAPLSIAPPEEGNGFVLRLVLHCAGEAAENAYLFLRDCGGGQADRYTIGRFVGRYR